MICFSHGVVVQNMELFSKKSVGTLIVIVKSQKIHGFNYIRLSNFWKVEKVVS
jgi:hypothetical protein